MLLGNDQKIMVLRTFILRKFLNLYIFFSLNYKALQLYKKIQRQDNKIEKVKFEWELFIIKTEFAEKIIDYETFCSN